MPPPRELGIVGKGRAIVENPAVVDEIHLAGLERKLHTEIGAGQDGVENIQGPALVGVQRLTRLFLTNFDPVAEITYDDFAAVPSDHWPANCRRFTFAEAA